MTSSSDPLLASGPGIVISERYRVTRVLGRGGMATVYAATDTRYDRNVAIKVLDPDLAAGIATDRFLREIAVVAKLTHPHIVPLLDSGENNGRLWFAMPLLDGASLRERIEREKQLPVSEAARICQDVARALAYAHAQGVVHRDIKPENVLISGGSAAVADFGLVKVIADSATTGLTNTGITVGTTFYMSPEQCSGGETVDARTDIYSLGCMLYEMLTGEPPYPGATAQAVMAKHFTDPIPKARRLRGTVSKALDDVITRSMAKLPADRYTDANAMAEAIQRAIDSGSHEAMATPPSFKSLSADALQPTVPRYRRAWIIAGAAALLATIAVLGKMVWSGRGGGAAELPRSVAVLPFANLSTSQDEEYFSTGMTDELIGALSKVEGLRVAARSSSYAFKGTGATHAEIGEKLKVGAVLEGSVRREGDQVRVLAELVSVADGSSLWRQQYDRTLSGVFALQEEVAQAIAGALRVRLAGGTSLVKQSTQDVEAYQLYLRGRYAWNQRTEASLRQAADFFDQAVKRDPEYARAWAGIADVHIVQALNFFAPAGANYREAKAAALKALSLDSTLAEAHASLGTVHFLHDRDWAAAEASYRRAIALDPEYPATHYFYALFLSGRNRVADALAEANRAMELDPLAPPMAQASGIVYVQSERYAEAIAPLRAAITLQPQYYFPHSWLAIALAKTGKTAEAVAEAKRAVELAPQNTLVAAINGYVLALTGNRAEALAVAERLTKAADSRPIPFHYVARIYDALGDQVGALRWLERALAEDEGQLSQLKTDGRLRTLASNPRYVQILKQLKLE